MDRDFYRIYFEVERTHWLMRFRRFVVRDQLRRFAPQFDSARAGRLLDLGCGSGFFIGELQREGYSDAYGVDPSPEAVAFGQAQGVRNLVEGHIERTPFSDEYFDVVVCMDVLEHLVDDQKGLSEIARVLKPGGVCIVTVPAYMFLWGVQDEVAHHFRRYTLRTLATLVRTSGQFEQRRATYFNTFLFPVVVVVRLASRWGFLHERESDFDLNTPLINHILFIVVSVERFVLRYINFPFGVSLVMVLIRR